MHIIGAHIGGRVVQLKGHPQSNAHPRRTKRIQTPRHAIRFDSTHLDGARRADDSVVHVSALYAGPILNVAKPLQHGVHAQVGDRRPPAEILACAQESESIIRTLQCPAVPQRTVNGMLRMGTHRPRLLRGLCRDPAMRGAQHASHSARWHAHNEKTSMLTANGPATEDVSRIV